MIEIALAAVVAACPARTLRGDVDGDGRRDTIALTRTCTLRAGARSVRLTPRPGRDLPRLLRLARINDRRGLEIVVALDAGASTDLVGVFTVFRGKIVRMTLQGKPALFPVGGTVAQRYGVDCELGLVLAKNVYARSRDKFELESRGYLAQGSTFAPVARSTQPITADTFLKFRTSAFGGCR